MRVVAENYEQTHTHTYMHTRDNYGNPRCAHARRGLTSVKRYDTIALGLLKKEEEEEEKKKKMKKKNAKSRIFLLRAVRT